MSQRIAAALDERALSSADPVEQVEAAPDEQPGKPHEVPPPESDKPSAVITAGLYLAGVGAVVVAAVLVLLLAAHRNRALAEETLQRKDELAKGPRVRVTRVALAPASRAVSLPGEVHPWIDSNIYAKIAGYLRDIRVDKGDPVKKGQIVAHVESPETDQTVVSARADLELKKVTAERDRTLVKQGLLSQQDMDTADAALKESEAALQGALTMQTYEVIRSPFAGVVTTRYVDPGALLPAATSTTTAAQPIIEVTDLSIVRIYVYLGQNDAALARVGDAVKITMDQRADVSLTGTITRMSDSLDPKTRTMLTEIDLPNTEPRIYPGEFLHVTLSFHTKSFPQIPVEALVMRNQKFYVAVITDNVVHFVPVETGQDDGLTVQIVSGLKGGETIALSAAADVEDNGPVQPISSEKK